MIVKRLDPHNEEPQHLVIHSKRGLLRIEYSDQSVEVLDMQMGEDRQVDILKNLVRLKSLRFIGGGELLQSLKKLKLDCPPLDREVLIDEPTAVIYHPKTKRIQIPKQGEAVLVKQKKRVLIVDDSKTIQKLLTKIIQSSESLEVMGVANGPREARAIIEKDRPDLVTLDIHMPEMNGVEFLKTYLGQTKIPTAVISSISKEEGPLVLEALSHGASTYLQKPSSADLSSVQEQIVEKLTCLSETKTYEIDKSLISNRVRFQHFDGIITIGSSTGGTQALEAIFLGLPAEIPPIVVVQHIPAVFSKALAERLDGLCPFHVKEAEDQESIQNNTIYIAPGGFQMKVEKFGSRFRIVTNDDPPMNRFKPSVDYLLKHFPAKYKGHVVSAILTGMGRDGAQGMLHMKNQGAFTIAQNEESCVVFGMPKEAIRLDAIEKVVSLEKISSTLVMEFNKLKYRNAA